MGGKKPLTPGFIDPDIVDLYDTFSDGLDEHLRMVWDSIEEELSALDKAYDDGGLSTNWGSPPASPPKRMRDRWGPEPVPIVGPRNVEDVLPFTDAKEAIFDALRRTSTPAQVTAMMRGDELLMEVAVKDRDGVDLHDEMWNGIDITKHILRMGYPGVHYYASDERSAKNVHIGGVVPGCSIGTEDSVGTFGCYIRSEKGRVYGLTCGHIFDQLQGDGDKKQKFYSIAPQDAKTGAKDAIKRLSSLFWDIDEVQRKIEKRVYARDKDGFLQLEEERQRCHTKYDYWKGQYFALEKLCDAKSRKLQAGTVRYTKFAVAEGGSSREAYPSQEDLALLRVSTIPANPNAVSYDGTSIGTLSGFKHHGPGMKVAKIGRTTGLTYGVILASPAYVRWEGDFLGTGEEPYMTEEVLVESIDDGEEAGFSSAGDSGAVVFDPSDMMIVGMIHGGHKPGAWVTYMHPIRDVLRRVEEAVGKVEVL